MRIRASRVIPSLVLAAALALGTTSCNLASTQSTMKEYDASDGVSINAGEVKVRNALVITDDKGLGSFVASFVNGSSTDTDVTIQVANKNGRQKLELTVPAGETVTTGKDKDQLLIDPLDAEAGGVVEVFVSVPGDSIDGKQVPVLDGTLAEYEELVPTAPAKTDEPHPKMRDSESDQQGTESPNPTQTTSPASGEDSAENNG